MIYCVEDDNSIRDLMIYTLTIAGFEAKGFADSESFWKEMQTGRPELVLLDIMLPGEDGISILKKLRSTPMTVTLPVIMATAKGSEYDRVIGLDLGADDYLCKPFGMMEMVSRIRAVLRRTSMNASWTGAKFPSPLRNMTSLSSFWNTSARCLPATSSCPLSGIRIIPARQGLLTCTSALCAPNSARAARRSVLSAASATGSDDHQEEQVTLYARQNIPFHLVRSSRHFDCIIRSHRGIFIQSLHK